MEDGRSALETLKLHPRLRILLCHASLNDMSGFDLCAACNTLRPGLLTICNALYSTNVLIKLVLLNSQIDHETTDRAMKAGAVDCLESPITVEVPNKHSAILHQFR